MARPSHRRGYALTLALCGLAIASALKAQSVADTFAFRPLDLPTPNEYRTGSGRPGPAYWQQRADYTIDATLDVAKNELRGKETIHYVNNSPTPLEYIWMHVEQNICAPESITNQLHAPPLAFQSSFFDFSCKGFNGGGKLEYVRAGGIALKRTKYGTTMRVDLPRALLSHDSISLDLAWSFPVPPYGAGRMGHDGSLYEIAQWYPRVAVYDDVRGWNHEPYIGAGEFYLEYGTFTVNLTLPASYIVAATGTLLNPELVLTQRQRVRLTAARASDTTVAIITAAEAGKPETRPSPKGEWLTWHYTAEHVRDFAFAAGPELRWDASNYDGILIETMYRPSAKLWVESNKVARAAIKYFSEQWFKYPYAHATTIEGPIEGMEYPMLTFVPKGVSREDLQWVISHEFGHEWFPMVVGSNERLYPWMDEGFNTFIDLGGAASYFRGTPYGDTIELAPLHQHPAHSHPGDEQPLIQRPIEGRDLYWMAYWKPALMMQMLRYEVLGKDRFDPAFRAYIKAWAYKHPTPADFFRVMRDQSGVDLDWFWRGWVYSTARLDQSVDSVTTHGDTTFINLTNRSTMVMPAELKVTFSDNTTDIVKLPVEMWNLGNHFAYRLTNAKPITRVDLDPRQGLPDIDRSNNVWTRK